MPRLAFSFRSLWPDTLRERVVAALVDPPIPQAQTFRESEERGLQTRLGPLSFVYQLASKMYAWSFAFRFSVPASAVPDLFPGTVIQDTVVWYDSRLGN